MAEYAAKIGIIPETRKKKGRNREPVRKNDARSMGGLSEKCSIFAAETKNL
jgi:hypothetical protein